MKLEARELSRRFGAVHALRGVSFTLPAGQRTALVGPNGSGKSTLNRILMGLLRYEGSVRVDGRDPFRERVAIAARMAYVPQIAPALAVGTDDLLRALARVRRIDRRLLDEVAGRLALPLRELGDRPFRALSGGTQQKVLIAAALAARADLLVLDEPTGSLDGDAREELFRLLGELPRGTGVLLCSHRVEELRRLVDHVLMLEEGELVWRGPADEFLERARHALAGDLRGLGGSALAGDRGLGGSALAGDRGLGGSALAGDLRGLAGSALGAPPASREPEGSER